MRCCDFSQMERCGRLRYSGHCAVRNKAIQGSSQVHNRHGQISNGSAVVNRQNLTYPVCKDLRLHLLKRNGEGGRQARSRQWRQHQRREDLIRHTKAKHRGACEVTEHSRSRRRDERVAEDHTGDLLVQSPSDAHRHWTGERLTNYYKLFADTYLHCDELDKLCVTKFNVRRVRDHSAVCIRRRSGEEWREEVTGTVKSGQQEYRSAHPAYRNASMRNDRCHARLIVGLTDHAKLCGQGPRTPPSPPDL
jgi:hypothetical protein